MLYCQGALFNFTPRFHVPSTEGAIHRCNRMVWRALPRAPPSKGDHISSVVGQAPRLLSVLVGALTSGIFLNPNSIFAHPNGKSCKQIMSVHHSLLRPSNHLCPRKCHMPRGLDWPFRFLRWSQFARYSCSSSLSDKGQPLCRIGPLCSALFGRHGGGLDLPQKRGELKLEIFSRFGG